MQVRVLIRRPLFCVPSPCQALGQQPRAVHQALALWKKGRGGAGNGHLRLCPPLRSALSTTGGHRGCPGMLFLSRGQRRQAGATHDCSLSPSGSIPHLGPAPSMSRGNLLICCREMEGLREKRTDGSLWSGGHLRVPSRPGSASSLPHPSPPIPGLRKAARTGFLGL